MLEVTNTLTARDMENQVLDSMDLEKEKGITIKSHAIQMEYKAKDGQTYVLNDATNNKSGKKLLPAAGPQAGDIIIFNNNGLFEMLKNILNSILLFFAVFSVI